MDSNRLLMSVAALLVAIVVQPAAKADDDDRDPQMRQHREHLRHRPWRVEIALVHQPADRQAEIDVGEIEQHQGEEEIGRREAEKPEE